MKRTHGVGATLAYALLVGGYLLASSIGLAASATKPVPPAYRGAIIVDASSGKVIFEDRADTPNPPASVTKLMTFLVVYEQIAAGKLSLSTEVPITAEDASMGGSQVWLQAGEIFTVEELLYAMMIQSANDCAHALARAAGGSREGFVAMMNSRAQSLGMTHTTFRTPHGLPAPSRKTSDGDLTTPRDLALLSRELLLHTTILRYTSVKVRTFRPGQPPPKEVIMRNHNHLVDRIRGVDGLKTGYTAGAGFCLAATAEREGRRVIVVTMGSPDVKTRNLKVAEFIERGFAELPASSRFYSEANPIRAVTPANTPEVVKAATSAAPAKSPSGSPAAAKPQDDAPPSVRFVPKR